MSALLARIVQADLDAHGPGYMRTVLQGLLDGGLIGDDGWTVWNPDPTLAPPYLIFAGVVHDTAARLVL